MKKLSQKYLWIGGIILLLVVGYAASQAGSTATKSFAGDGAYTGGMNALMDDMAMAESVASRASYDMAEESLIPVPSPTAGEIGADVEQRIIREGWMSLEVASVEESIDAISEIANSVGGFVDQTNASEDYQGRRVGSASIRVPSEAFSQALSDIKEVGLRVIDESTNANDVTEQYTDLQTRLSVAQEEEAAYLSLLDRAASVSDLLQVQRELSNVRVRIESLQGQIQYLENRTDYSTISVSLEEDSVISVPTKRFRLNAVIKDATQGLIYIAQSVVTATVWAVVIGIGIGVPLGLLWWLGRLVWRKVKKRK